MMTAFWWFLGIVALYYALALWLTYGRGPFRFVYNPLVAWLLRRIGKDGITIGARCYVEHPALIAEFPNGLEPLHLPIASDARKWWRHEKQHNRQWRVRPLMGPVYLFWGFFGYKNNPLEIEAEREEG